MANNVLYDFKNFGINVQIGKNLTLESNIVVSIKERDGFVMTQGSPDKWAGIAICSYRGMVSCPQIYARNNIVAGAVYIGMTALAHNCG